MNIQIPPLTQMPPSINHAMSSLRSKIVLFLSAQQRKIVAVASFVFATLVLSYVFARYCLSNRRGDDLPRVVIVPDEVQKEYEPLSDDQRISPLPEEKGPLSQIEKSPVAQVESETLQVVAQKILPHPVRDVQNVGGNAKVMKKSPVLLPSHQFSDPKLYFEAQNLTLRNLRDLNADDRQKVVQKFQLQDAIDSMGKPSFFQTLETVDESILELLNLIDLKIDKRKVEYALLTDEKLKAVTLREVEDCTESQTLIIFFRRALLGPQSQGAIVKPDDILDLSILDMHHLEITDIHDCIQDIPHSVFYFLSDDQLKKLDVSLPSEKQIDNLFSCKLGIKEDKRRFALLPADQVNGILQKLTDYQMYLLSDEHLKKLEVSKLAVQDLKRLFSKNQGTREDKRRFDLLQASQAQAIEDKVNL